MFHKLHTSIHTLHDRLVQLKNDATSCCCCGCFGAFVTESCGLVDIRLIVGELWLINKWLWIMVNSGELWLILMVDGLLNCVLYSHGGTPSSLDDAGWFMSWKIPWKWMRTAGCPYFRKPPYELKILTHQFVHCVQSIFLNLSYPNLGIVIKRATQNDCFRPKIHGGSDDSTGCLCCRQAATEALSWCPVS